MKKKFIIVMVIFSLLTLTIGVYVIVSVQNATSTLSKLISLYQVEILRSRLLIQIKVMQSDLYLKDTHLASEKDTHMRNLKNLTELSNTCLGCHHTDEITKTLLGLKNHIEDYSAAFSSVIAISGDSEKMQREKNAAFLKGESLIREVTNMIQCYSPKLGRKTESSLINIARTKIVVFALVGIGPIIAVIITVLLVQGFTKPINTILAAIKTLKAGNLDYRIDGLKDECGVVASQFNEMVCSINEHMRNMQRAEQMTVAGEMAASIAHEIKNPIAGLKIALRMLSENKELSQAENEIVEASSQQIKRMESLIKDMLDFARPNEPEYCLTDMNILVEKTMSFVTLMSSQSDTSPDVTVVKALCEESADILVDPMQMQQAVMNVVMNAYEAMREKGTLTVGTRRLGAEFSISVADSGRGIDDRGMEKIFKPFNTTKLSGTGLGLAITKGIIERHGGTITVESKLGEGTTVTMNLPLKIGEPSLEGNKLQ